MALIGVPFLLGKERSWFRSLWILEEIKRAVFGSERYKSPSPDGFSMAFCQDKRDLLKVELENVFKEFFDGGILNRSLTETFINLIPKKEKANRVKD